MHWLYGVAAAVAVAGMAASEYRSQQARRRRPVASVTTAPFTDDAEARAAALELREEVEREIAASEEHHAKVQALLDAAHAVLVDAEDGGAPTGDHLRALWRAYMELGNPKVLAEMDAVEGGDAG